MCKSRMNEAKRFDVTKKMRPYYILSLLQERELMRAELIQFEGENQGYISSAASIMAASLIEEILEVMDE